MHKKVLLFILIIVLAVFVGTVGAQDDVDPSGVTIEYWHEWDGAQGEGMTEMISIFNETNEWGITVVENPLGGSGDVRDAVSVGITSGELPNIAGATFVTEAMGYYLDDVLVPFDAYIESETWGFSEEELELFNADIIGSNRPPQSPFESLLLSWPIGLSAEVMSVNITLLNELSESGAIDFEGAPTTAEEFRAAACAANDLDGVTAGYGARPSGDHAMLWMANFGGQIFDYEADAYVFTDEGAIAGLQFLQDIYNDGCAYIPDGGFFANTDEFALGRSIFAPGSSVGVPFIQGGMDSEGLEYDWVNVPFPGGPAGQHIDVFSRGLGILEGTPEENLAAWLFIKWWATTPEAQVIWTESAQYQPYNLETPGAVSDEFLASAPQYASFAEALQDPDLQVIDLPRHQNTFQAVSITLGNLFSNITVGGMDIEEAAATAEAEANEIYQEDLEDAADF